MTVLANNFFIVGGRLSGAILATAAAPPFGQFDSGLRNRTRVRNSAKAPAEFQLLTFEVTIEILMWTNRLEENQPHLVVARIP